MFDLEVLTPAGIDEAMPLLQKHKEEIAHYQDIELNPDKEFYLSMQEAGALRFYTIRDQSKLVGYAVFFIKRNAHYVDSVQALQDILYLDPPLRGKMVGYRFIKWCDDELRREKVQVVYHHIKAKEGLDFSPMLERLGYEFVDKIYAKRLDV